MKTILAWIGGLALVVGMIGGGYYFGVRSREPNFPVRAAILLISGDIQNCGAVYEQLAEGNVSEAKILLQNHAAGNVIIIRNFLRKAPPDFSAHTQAAGVLQHLQSIPNMFAISPDQSLLSQGSVDACLQEAIEIAKAKQQAALKQIRGTRTGQSGGRD